MSKRSLRKNRHIIPTSTFKECVAGGRKRYLDNNVDTNEVPLSKEEVEALDKGFAPPGPGAPHVHGVDCDHSGGDI